MFYDVLMDSQFRTQVHVSQFVGELEHAARFLSDVDGRVLGEILVRESVKLVEPLVVYDGFGCSVRGCSVTVAGRLAKRGCSRSDTRCCSDSRYWLKMALESVVSPERSGPNASHGIWCSGLLQANATPKRWQHTTV